MEFRILGPLEVEADGRLLKLGGAQPRALLALLLLHANEVVPRDRLIEELWDGRPPETAATAIQVHVSQLRKALGRDVIVTQRPGYLIRATDGELDLVRFEQAVERAQAAAPADAAELLKGALALWRGIPFADVDSPFARTARTRLEEQRLGALEQRIDADLELGRHTQLVPELEGLVEEHPLRERLRGQLMLSLYRAGRQADALAAYQEGRRLLVDELGLEPGEELRRIERAILEQDSSLLPAPSSRSSRPPTVETPIRPRPPARPAQQQRKVVTLVFCDLAESTALGAATDPEVLEGRLRRYFERMAAIVERHGGRVEKFIGDAVMAVFGVPVAHEDDALRALRAAAEMRDAMPELQLQARIGVNTGEILTSKVGTLVTGDAVNVAARLEQAAQPGEVLVGASTRALVGGAVEAEEVEPLELKGKAEPVEAFRLLAVGEPPARAHDRPFVGRRREVELPREAWERANAQQACELFTVIGEAGVGKSRLVAEALEAIDARVTRARCLPYGEGITYWPVVEVIKQLGALPSDEDAAAAVRSLLGESDRPTTADEIAWAFRKLLEEQAPLVVLLDDLQWGEETFLDLVESTRLLSVGAPILLLCMARPELRERRPTWPESLRLEPLAPGEAGELIGQSLPEAVRTQIAERAGGNPLFITEMLALATAGGELDVPPTLRALLAARLDQLDPQERAVLERGAVEGEIFHRGAVQALADEPEVLTRLAALVRHDLVRPDRPQLPGEDAFRFRHLLIRDAAYDALPKAVRADLHRRFADWLEHKKALVEQDEVAGYHLERAAHLEAELGEPDPALTLRAADRLLTAGRRALDRDDVRAAVPLLERALTLTRPHRSDVHAELDLARARMQEPPRAAAICEAAAVRAAEAGDETGEALARAMALFHRLFVEPVSVDELERLLLEVRPQLEAIDDHAGLAQVWWALGFGVANSRGRPDDWATASDRGYRESRLAGRAATAPPDLGAALAIGSRPADECLELIDRRLTESPSAWLQLNRGWLLAMLERGEEGRQIAEEADARNRELEDVRWGDWMLAEISSLAGDYEDATNRLGVLCEWLESREQFALVGTYLARRGRLLCLLGRFDEAEQLGTRASALDEEFNAAVEGGEPVCRQVLARVRAHRGELADAERLAREAVTLTEENQLLNDKSAALWDLADVLAAANRVDEAVAAFDRALEGCERKKNLALARQIRERRDSVLAGAG